MTEQMTAYFHGNLLVSSKMSDGAEGWRDFAVMYISVTGVSMWIKSTRQKHLRPDKGDYLYINCSPPVLLRKYFSYLQIQRRVFFCVFFLNLLLSRLCGCVLDDVSHVKSCCAMTQSH